MAKRILSSCSDEEFAQIVAEHTSIRQVALALGYSPNLGAGFSAIKKRIQDLDLSIEHFTSKPKESVKWTRETAFQNGTNIGSTKLRKLFLEEHTQDYVCSICGQPPEWQGKPLTLILDHIDGNHTNNCLSNLRWVCPNCNQQLPTTGSKNKKQKKEQNRCIDCGRPIHETSTRCKKCAIKYRNESNIYAKVSRDILKNKIRNESFAQIAKEYGYNDGNAVKKWCMHYNLPYRKKDIVLYADEEWNSI